MVFKVLITGRNGFIGTSLFKALQVKPEYQLLAVDHIDLLDTAKLTSILKDFSPDYIFHLATYGNYHDQEDDSQTFSANVVSLYNLLQATLTIPYKAFINFGSSSEYGQKHYPMAETDLPEALTMYGCTKVAGTYLARAYAKKYSKPIVTVRPFSVFGPGERESKFIPTVIKSLLTETEMELDIAAKHDWIYITDFLTALGAITESADLLSNQVINIGSGREYTNLEIINWLEIFANKKLNYKAKIDLRPNDSKSWKADIHKIKLFNWKPKWNISPALFETYTYYKGKYYEN